ncbi:BLUF domain-containing protein [Salipiger mangrovisoli]|uniref:BLUF domain-containing protein n=1 Tax=Salipiger mangrovisoli TaxID=2865933 RepID=A0ABR9XB64_9RHOB|nr:BLUF domain-containing protein [Salipiger mangrovisoli]MBE9640843.1 BLUF domain-containing protein [Salipiger mangrovisoli]
MHAIRLPFHEGHDNPPRVHKLLAIGDVAAPDPLHARPSDRAFQRSPPRMIYQLLYTSRSAAPRGDASDIDILTAALANNQLLGVTGCLLREEHGFCQVLEGAKETVRTLFELIRRDPRHFGVIERINRRVPVRSFANWTMCYGALSAEDTTFLRHRFASEGRNLTLVLDRVREIAVAG